MIKKLLKILRKAYGLLNQDKQPLGRNWKMFSNKTYSNNLIYQQLIDEKPCMIARFGSTEMLCLMNFVGVKQNNRNWITYVKGISNLWWWEKSTIQQMCDWSGFFPPTIDMVESFSQLMLNDITQIDILGSWLHSEDYFSGSLTNAKRVVLEDLEPFFSDNPWTKALENKRVLVVHPFAETIKSQYAKRDLLFSDNLLPEFELITLKAVQSVANEKTEFDSWFDALDFMKGEMDKLDYDICIVGCGAYGLPLAAHAKRMGKKSIHLAGATQLLFGIKGRRWENFIVWPYMNLFNKHWVRPGELEKPKNAGIVEGACYW